jgi:peptidylprolyl isomerase
MIKRSLIVPLSLMLVIFIGATGCKGEVLAKNGDTVIVDYTGKLSDGTVFDTSEGGEPLEFTLGQGKMIPGFEQAVLGMKVGETKTVDIPTDQAYGPRSDDMIIEVGRSELPNDMEPQVGMQLQMTQPDGSTAIVTITEVSDTNVRLDTNHPLAGQDLAFEIKLVEIKKAQSGTASNLNTSLQEAFANGKPTLAEFGSSTCIPCKQMKPILEKLSIEYSGRMNVVLVEVYEQRELTQRHEIMAIPTQILFDAGGEELTRHVGFWSQEDIISQLKKSGIY